MNTLPIEQSMYNVMHVVGDIDSMSALVSQLGAAVGKVWLQ